MSRHSDKTTMSLFVSLHRVVIGPCWYHRGRWTFYAVCGELKLNSLKRKKDLCFCFYYFIIFVIYDYWGKGILFFAFRPSKSLILLVNWLIILDSLVRNIMWVQIKLSRRKPFPDPETWPSRGHPAIKRVPRFPFNCSSIPRDPPRRFYVLDLR